ncbi:cupin [Streptomyces sp. A1277]|uniref:JmjC domain-containing protein n=1 Tax=Streptomyces sp. A1277 TaxID=2563103 RepID=UPI0010A2279B|nr:cupin domain-containing protein [Streptomyces sp. A1277]THA29662.1 cupin [Streptomyces sp. A1277]
MSLRLLLPEEGVTDLLLTWPDEPRVYERGTTALDETVTADFLKDYLFTGCAPADEIAVVKAPHPSLNRAAFTTNGRSDAGKLRRLHENGHTIRLGNLQRVLPYMAHLSRRLQEETGCSNYVHAFLTPPGSQGLRHHWDQQMAVIVQLSGTKRWQLWRPPVEAPMREFNESWRVWRDDYIPMWEAQGPDTEFDLTPGQSFLLPRGWVHNPRVTGSEEASTHLTFALRERTPLWLAEKLMADAITESGFRRVIRPGQLAGAELSGQLLGVRDALVQYLAGIDVTQVATAVRQAAVSELEYTT